MKRFNPSQKVCAIALSLATAGLCVALPVSAQTSSPLPDSTAPGTTIAPDSDVTTTDDIDNETDWGWLGLFGLLGLAGLVRKPQENRRTDTYVDPATTTTTRSDYNR
ncbi:MAG: WGxxGxxG-CTERM domain-containing protein [Oscillatoriophycideae cyanobacterium NC_groundwater_1537_Pr4_S-0.65um_50_18]|nr:WGxxGxxG-CTERM domain-containing protein [Oscillatoriophycideae cyanobacterium NC_groundwater_1537_Pr4_S-0.65um_50_18]